MKIDNLRPGAQKVELGACKSTKAMVRYLALEGWIDGTVYCTKCEYSRNLMADPILLKREGKTTWLTQMQCRKCGCDKLTFSQK